jgi:predicted DNA-binding transcriptional regulator AlpA
MTNATRDELVPDPEVCREFSITSMTLWRWDHDPELRFPPPVRIRKRKFRSRRALEAFKQQMLAGAVKAA